NPAMFRGRYIVFTEVTDAGGIRRGDPVQMLGVNIGRVLRFKMDKNKGTVILRLEIEGEYQLPKDSHVALRTLSLLSGVVASVVPGKSDAMVANNESLPGQAEQNMMETVNRLATHSEEVLKRVNEMVSPEMVTQVHESSADLRDTMRNLSKITTEQRGQLLALTESLKKSATGMETVTSNLQATSANAKELTARPELTATIQRLDTLTTQMQTTSQTLDRAASSM